MLAESTFQDILFQCHDQLMLFRQCKQTLLVKRFYKACVDQSTLKTFAFQILTHFMCCLYHAADCDQGNAFFIIEQFAFAVYDLSTMLRKPVIGFAPWITQGDRTVRGNCKFQHIGQLPFVFWCHHAHIRDQR